MSTTQKIQVVLEVELTHDMQARSSYPLEGQIPSPDAELEETYARELLALLRADPACYTEFVKTVVLGEIQTFEESRALVGLSGIPCPYTASLAILREFMPRLSLPAQEHFERAEVENWLSESVDLLFNAVKARPIKMTVTYPAAQPPAGPQVNSI